MRCVIRRISNSATSNLIIDRPTSCIDYFDKTVIDEDAPSLIQGKQYNHSNGCRTSVGIRRFLSMEELTFTPSAKILVVRHHVISSTRILKCPPDLSTSNRRCTSYRRRVTTRASMKGTKRTFRLALDRSLTTHIFNTYNNGRDKSFEVRFKFVEAI